MKYTRLQLSASWTIDVQSTSFLVRLYPLDLTLRTREVTPLQTSTEPLAPVAANVNANNLTD
ncbi:hypothetical protein T05_6108 [Trichinella murrelli]|uniref:Uncharacterized protein n=1 Tax=Trichinella murrelli TaxID=144512 RepID=A0A0V0ST46_9BILA|nr:hypothetical protein T05_6108 [Trichinella murrelli]